jgi:glycosyltransferase involved in cell wall biosynthesis
MRIAWIGPYDINRIAHRLDEQFETPFHPATWIRNAANALARHPDVELHILMHDKRFSKDYRFTENGIHFHLFHAPIPQIPRPLALYQLDRWKYYAELKTINPDIVHGHGTENIFSYIAVTSGYPHVISIQAIIENLVKEYKRISRRMFEHMIVQFVERYTVRRAKNFIIKAPFAASFIRKHNTKASIHLLENIIHERYFAVERIKQGSIKKIVFVGTLINTKGVEELIAAFHIIAVEFPDTELHLIGTGTTTYVDSVLTPMIRSGPGRDQIILRGHLSENDIAELYAEAAMLVLPSYFDTSPNVVAEAMVSGVPVIGTDVGGIPFMVNTGKTGTIVPLRDAQKLTESMKIYLSNPALAEKHAQAGRSEARTRYGEQRFVDQVLKIYRSIIA